MLRFA